MAVSETDPLPRQHMHTYSLLINDGTSHPDPSRTATGEMRASTQWPPRETERPCHLSSQEISFGSKQDEYHNVRHHGWNGLCSTVCKKMKSLFDSHWPLSCFMAIAFPGFWLPSKRKSIWPLTFIPVLLLPVGLGAHFFFMLTQGRSIHLGSKIFLSALWISAFASYVFALYYFRYQSQEWIRDLNRRQCRAINVALFTGIFLISWVLFGNVYYKVVFDVVHFKKTLLQNCHRPVACNAVFYTLAMSVYWGMYSSVAVCCVFFSLCLSMVNDLDKGYRRIAKCNGSVTDALFIHSEVRKQIGQRVNSIRVWFAFQMIFFVVVLLANLVEWWEATRQLRYVHQYMAQICGTLVVVYKVFFPFLSASYVTWHESTLVQDLNDKHDFSSDETFHSRKNLELFLKQSKRRGYGFRLFKIQITMTIAIFSLLGSGFGLIHNFKS